MADNFEMGDSQSGQGDKQAGSPSKQETSVAVANMDEIN